LAASGRSSRVQARIRLARAAVDGSLMQPLSPMRHDPKGIGGDLTLTFDQMVMHGVVRDQLASAVARTVGWDGDNAINEGSFLELFVPVASDDPDSLVYMREFRRAWMVIFCPVTPGAVAAGHRGPFMGDEGPCDDLGSEYGSRILLRRPRTAPPVLEFYHHGDEGSPSRTSKHDVPEVSEPASEGDYKCLDPSCKDAGDVIPEVFSPTAQTETSFEELCDVPSEIASPIAGSGYPSSPDHPHPRELTILASDQN